MPTQRRSTQGFTLVELSIVLVILGLLVGGVLVGRDLLKAQTLRNMATQASNYNTAFQQFKQKYGYKPGDFPRAIATWGATGITSATVGDPYGYDCGGVPTTTSATCNGNGDGYVNTNGPQNETNLLWQHLALAGMIEGQFMGAPSAAGSNTVVAGYNGPAGAYPKSVWAFAPYGAWGWSWDFFPSVTGVEFFYLGANKTTFNSPPVLDGPVKPGDLFVLDTKIDDGLPDQGKVQGNNFKDTAAQSYEACVNDYGGAVAPAYALSDPGVSGVTGGLMGCVAVFVPDASTASR